MIKRPLVSVVIPIYNSSEYIEDTINSILNQSYNNLEIILVDDSSTDSSLQICNALAFQDSRVFVLSLKENLGKANAMNEGLVRTNGEYLAFIDSDDLWLNDKIYKQLKYMLENNFSLTCTAYRQFSDSYSRVINAPKQAGYKEMLKYCRVGYSTVMLKKSEFSYLSFPDLRKRQDYAFWLKIVKEHYIYGLNEVLTEYRLRKESLSRNKIKLLKWNFLVYYKVEKLSLIKSFYFLIWDVVSKVFFLK